MKKSGPPLKDTESSRWRTRLSLNTIETAVLSVLVLGFAREVATYVSFFQACRMLILASLCLYGCCWFVATPQREGIWKFAEASHSLMWMMGIANLILAGVASPWCWLLIAPVVAFYLSVAGRDLRDGWKEAGSWSGPN